MNRILNHRGLRTAALALCTLTVCAAPMLAQDTAPPAPQQGGGPGGYGGGRGGRGGNPEAQLERMTKELSLTPDQVTAVKAINEDSRKQMMALRDDTTTPQDQRRDKMMAIREASNAKVRALLTDDQKTKFDAMQAQMRDRMRNGGGPGGPGGGPGGPPPPPAQ